MIVLKRQRDYMFSVEKLQVCDLKEEYFEDTNKINNILEESCDVGDGLFVSKGKYGEIVELLSNIDCDLYLYRKLIEQLITSRDNLKQELDSERKVLYGKEHSG